MLVNAVAALCPAVWACTFWPAQKPKPPLSAPRLKYAM